MEEAYLEIYDILLYRAASIVGNTEDAKDIVQDLYVKIRAQGRTADNARGYLYGMVTNMARMHLREQARHRALERAAMPTGECIAMPAVPYLDDMLAPLTELQRQVVRLHDIEGYSCVETAFRLKRTPVAVKKQLALAHRKLKEQCNKQT